MIFSVFFSNLWDYIKEHSKEMFSTVIVILICFLAIIIGYIVEKKFTARKGQKKYIISLANNLYSFYKWIVIFVGILIVCSAWGVKLTAVLIGIAIVLIGISIGARRIVADIIHGLIITFSDYFDIDDFVVINGFKGYVKEIRLRSTKLINVNNEVKIISNSDIRDISNYSKHPYVSSFEMIIDSKHQIDKVILLLEDNMGNINEKIEGIIEGPNILGITDVVNEGTIIRVVIKSIIDVNNLIISGVKKYTREILDLNKIEFKFCNKENKND